jgi:hypothetical protein
VTPILGFVMNGDFVVLAALLNKPEPVAAAIFRKDRFATSLEPPKSSQRKTA